MDLTTIAIICIVVGLIFLIVEALTPGVFAVIPGAVLVVIGALGYTVDGFLESIWLLPIAIIVAAVVSIVTIKGYQLLAKPEPPTTTVAESLVGKDGVVTVAVEPGSLKGKVKIGTEIWSATSDAHIEKGRAVTVSDGAGVHVKVRSKN
ncbi:MAG: NfeD family protein [Candidatus Methanoplasma sp.]|jgi:membrane protein implicated in regulation of membrane protease activity|nr:NfeD family protein [Candidatus Methanoplasma sp.]